MSTVAIRQKLHHYIETAKDKKVKAIFAMVEEEIEETSEHWKDENFVAELRRREANYKTGTAKLLTLEQAVTKARLAVSRKK